LYPSPASCPRAPECVEEEFHQLRHSEVRASARCAYTPFAVIGTTKGSTQDGQQLARLLLGPGRSRRGPHRALKRGQGASCFRRLEQQLESILVGELGTLWILALRTGLQCPSAGVASCRAPSFHRSILFARRPPESSWPIGRRRCLRSVEHSCPGEFATARATPRSAARRYHRSSIF
jgi:hypothetical protein